MKVNLGEILTKAWQITWKYKVLWIFGILAGCGGANGNRFNYSGNNGGGSGGSGSGGNGFNGPLPEPFRRFENMQPAQAVQQFLSQYMAIIVGVILLLCILWFLFYFLGVMGKVGLIKGANKGDKGAQSMSFGELWTESTPYFWRMFGLRLLVGLPFFLLFVIIMVVLGTIGFSAARGGVSEGGLAALFIGLGGIFFALICIIALISLIVGMVVSQAENAIVLEDLGVLDGFRRGWHVFTANLLAIILIALILGVIGWIVNLIVALPMIAILLPVAVSFAATGAKNFMIPLMIGGLCFVVYLPVLLTLSGILETYSQSVWTLGYNRMTAAPAATPLVPEPLEPAGPASTF